LFVPATVGLPPLGTTGQALTKKTDTDFDVEWTTPVTAEVFIGPEAPSPRGSYVVWIDNNALAVNPFVDGPGNLLHGFWAADPSWTDKPPVSGLVIFL